MTYRHTTQTGVSAGQQTVRPQNEWRWPIAVYLYLAGMGAGSFAVGLLADWTLHPDVPSAGILLWGPLLVVLGAPFLVLDLEQKTRFWRACLNPKTSWAARGFMILSALMATGLAAFGLAVLPHGLPVVGWLAGHAILVRIVEATALALSLGTAAYTGVFLRSVRHVSLWNTWLLPVLFSLSALSTGAAALIVVLLVFALTGGSASAAALTRTLIPVTMLLLVLEGLSLAWLLSVLRRSGRVPEKTIRHLAVKSGPSLVLALAFLVCAMSAPMSSGTLPSGVYSTMALIGGAVVLAGGFLLRHDFVKSGVKDAHPWLAVAPVLYSRMPLAMAPAAPAAVRTGVKARMKMPLARAAERTERVVFEVAFSLFRGGANEPVRSRVRVLAALYRSWRHPVRLEYTVDTETS